MSKAGDLKIGDLAGATGTKVETIRYYERIGLLPEPGRTEGNYRIYDAGHLSRLGFIRRARELGFSVADVRELLGLAERQESSCAAVDRLVGRHLATVEQKIAALKRLRGELRETLTACKGGRVAECRVIQALSPLPSSSRRSSRRAGPPTRV
jgi:DNA-binding transcriptional MerR regulator